ncbi:MAG: hypothetical protein JSR82_14990 [Verrucomicrobia bacterium]|nr:hypothetical protein [Verrucomicrobiota bacterium]
MTRDVVITAIREGIPFELRMADGRSYVVRDQFSIALGPTNAVVIDERGLPHVLPLLTVTGLSYLPPESPSQAA